jgi:phage tail-like protein
MAADDEEDPLVGLNFYLELDETQIGAFRECSGLEVEVEVIEVRHNDAKGKMIIRKVPGANKYGPITLKKGQTTSKALWDKFALSLGNQIVAGKRPTGFKRRTGAIVIKDVTGQKEVARYSFIGAWISKYKGGELNTTSNNLAVEEVTIVHEGMFRVL